MLARAFLHQSDPARFHTNGRVKRCCGSCVEDLWVNRRQLILSALAGLVVPTWADVETDRELLLRLCGVNFQTDASLRHDLYLYRQGEIGEELLINRGFSSRLSCRTSSSTLDQTVTGSPSE